MRMIGKATVAVGVAATVGLGALSATAATASAASSASSSLNAKESTGLVFSREGERLARDLYTVFADKYDAAVFSRIASSEQRHFDAVGSLLAKYSVPDPSAGAAPGVYANPVLQKLYDDWKLSGLTSVQAAYAVGVELEKRDIADLRALADATSNADLDRVYGQLEKGSEHHLSAFTAAGNGRTAVMNGATGSATGQGRGAARHGSGGCMHNSRGR